jgi:hypothetical protein
VGGSRVTRCALVCLVAAAWGGCNSPHAVIDTTHPTLPSSVIGTVPVPAAALVSVVVEPSAVFSGDGATGRVLLSFPAPPEGYGVALSTSHAAATVPASVTVPAGADAAPFAIATDSGAGETDVSIAASAEGRAAGAALAVWTKTPSFVATWTDPGQRIVASRVTAAGQWRANCYGSLVSVGASQNPVVYHLLFGAPQDTPLTSGTYEDAQTTWSTRSPTRPLLDVSASGFLSCAAPEISRFTVTEAEFVADSLGTVRRFAVRFEQRCGAVTIRGELHAVDVPPTHTSGPRCTLPE